MTFTSTTPSAGARSDLDQEPETASALAVSLRGVVRRMGRETVLRGIDFDLAPGRLVVLRGSNGSGKTTLLRLLATRLRPHGGHGTVFGNDLVSGAATVRTRVGLLSSVGGSYPVLTARENLRLAASLAGSLASAMEGPQGSSLEGSHPEPAANRMAPDRPDEGAIDACLARVGLAHAADKQARHFSSGMKKRLGFARQLLLATDLWLLDEPYAALDEEGKRLVDECLTEARASGRTVLLASHEQDRHALKPDAVVELVEGRLRLVDRLAQAAAGGQPAARPEPAS